MRQHNFRQKSRAENGCRFCVYKCIYERLTCVTQAAFEIEFANQIKNDWIIDNRLKRQVDIFDLNTGQSIDFVMYQIVLITKKKSEKNKI